MVALQDGENPIWRKYNATSLMLHPAVHCDVKAKHRLRADCAQRGCQAEAGEAVAASSDVKLHLFQREH